MCCAVLLQRDPYPSQEAKKRLLSSLQFSPRRHGALSRMRQSDSFGCRRRNRADRRGAASPCARGAHSAHGPRYDKQKRGARGIDSELEKGETDILVGTQMITKGHDVTGVTLVGALLADLSLNLPDSLPREPFSY